MGVTNYVFDPDPHLPGMIGGPNPKKEGLANKSGGAVQYGVAVSTTANAGEFGGVPASDAAFAGITVFQHARLDTTSDASTATILEDERSEVLKRGQIYARVNEAVDPTSTVYVNTTTGQLQGNATGAFVLLNAQFKEAVTAAGVVLVEINRP